jgi:methionyl-tRNA formyltransferase
MKTVILYARRNTGLMALVYLLTKQIKLKVISDDSEIQRFAILHGARTTEIGDMEYDLFLCVHGNKIIPKEFLKEKKCINIHPCLFQYKGKNPIEKYIANKDTVASVESHYMTEVVDEGELVYRRFFNTPVCNTYADFYNIALPVYIDVFHCTLLKAGI